VFELDASNAREYLRSRPEPSGPISRIVPLGGGVSNTVLLVECDDGSHFVLKQSLGKLRVEQDWYSDRTRIQREWACMQRLRTVLPAGSVPEVIFSDAENCLFAMTAAEEGVLTWKQHLMAGTISEATAEAVGAILGTLIASSFCDEQAQHEFGDLRVFDELRLDPYYRATARHHPDLKTRFDDLITRARTRRVALVHGDFSPKNFLVSTGDPARVMAIDFEVIHYGDPCFDTAFLLNHLLLKSFYRPAWRERYQACAAAFWGAVCQTAPEAMTDLESGTLHHLPALLLARIDGKSPAEYIQDSELKQRIRSFARQAIALPPQRVLELWQLLP
jgi:5-methylthioribose kinase